MSLEKYDINAENNTPQILYGVPDFIRKEMEEKKEAEKKELSFKEIGRASCRERV